MATWPTSLPQYPFQSGYVEGPEDNEIRTKMDTGVIKNRNRYTKSITVFTVKMRLSSLQVSTFETFWEITLKKGSQSFDWVHPRKQTPIKVRISGAYAISVVSANDYVLSMKIREKL